MLDSKTSHALIFNADSIGISQKYNISRSIEILSNERLKKDKTKPIKIEKYMYENLCRNRCITRGHDPKNIDASLYFFLTLGETLMLF